MKYFVGFLLIFFLLLITDHIDVQGQGRKKKSTSTKSTTPTPNPYKDFMELNSMTKKALHSGCPFMHNNIGEKMLRDIGCDKSTTFCYELGYSAKFSRRFAVQDHSTTKHCEIVLPKSKKNRVIAGTVIGPFDQLIDKVGFCDEFCYISGAFLEDYDIAKHLDMAMAIVDDGTIWRHVNCGSTPPGHTFKPYTGTTLPPISGGNTDQSGEIATITPPIHPSAATESPPPPCTLPPCSFKIDKMHPGTKLRIQAQRTGPGFKIMLVHGLPEQDIFKIGEQYSKERKSYDLRPKFGQLPLFIEVPIVSEWKPDDSKFRLITYRNTKFSTDASNEERWYGLDDRTFYQDGKELDAFTNTDKIFDLTIRIGEDAFELELDGIPLKPHYKFRMPLCSVNTLAFQGDLRLLRPPEIDYSQSYRKNFAVEIRQQLQNQFIWRVKIHVNKDAKQFTIAFNKDTPGVVGPLDNATIARFDGEFEHFGESGLIAIFKFEPDKELILKSYTNANQEPEEKTTKGLMEPENLLERGQVYWLKFKFGADNLYKVYKEVDDGHSEKMGEYRAYDPKLAPGRLQASTINHVWYEGDMEVLQSVEEDLDWKPNEFPRIKMINLKNPLSPGKVIRVEGKILDGISQRDERAIRISLSMNDAALSKKELNEGDDHVHALLIELKPLGVSYFAYHTGQKWSEQTVCRLTEETMIYPDDYFNVNITVRKDDYLIEESKCKKAMNLSHHLPYWAVKFVKVVGPFETKGDITEIEPPRRPCPKLPCSIKLQNVYPGSEVVIEGIRTGEKVALKLLQGGPGRDDVWLQNSGETREGVDRDRVIYMPFSMEGPIKPFNPFSSDYIMFADDYKEKRGELNQDEETTATKPFYKGENFKLVIKFTAEQFEVNVNEQPLKSYKNPAHQLFPTYYLQLDYGLKLTSQPEFIPSKQPKTNFAIDLKQTLSVGSEIIVKGRISANLKRFTVALNKDTAKQATAEDKHKVGDTGLAANFRFTKKTLVTNCYTRAFEKTKDVFPSERDNQNLFEAGEEFELRIKVEEDHYRLETGNGDYLGQYKHYHKTEANKRLPPDVINHIWFGGQVDIHEVQVKHASHRDVLKLSSPLMIGDAISIVGKLKTDFGTARHKAQITLSMNDPTLNAKKIVDGAFHIHALVFKFVSKQLVEVSAFYGGSPWMGTQTAEGKYELTKLHLEVDEPIKVKIYVSELNYEISIFEGGDGGERFVFGDNLDRALFEHRLPYWAVQSIKVTGPFELTEDIKLEHA